MPSEVLEEAPSGIDGGGEVGVDIEDEDVVEVGGNGF